MVTDREITIIRLHKHYLRNILFAEGGLMAQPNVYLEAMEMIEEFTSDAG